MASDRIDPFAIGAAWTARLAEGLEKSMAVRARGLSPEARIFDMHFAEFMRDEIGMVRRIYAHFGVPLGAEAEARMRRFLGDNPAGRHGGHRYSLAAAGLDETVERRRYAAYQERFGIGPEPAA